MQMEPEGTKQNGHDFYGRAGSDYSSGHEENVSHRSGDSPKASCFFEKKQGIDLHQSRRIKNSFAEKRQSGPGIMFPPSNQLFASRGSIRSIDESLPGGEQDPEYLKRAIQICQEKIQRLEEKLMEVMQRLRPNGHNNETFDDEGLKSNIDQFKSLYSSGRKKQANESVRRSQLPIHHKKIVSVEQIGRLQQSVVDGLESHDMSEHKRQLTNIEYNDSQSQVFIETEQSNPFFRKITTHFHEADDVELLNHLEEPTT